MMLKIFVLVLIIIIGLQNGQGKFLLENTNAPWPLDDSITEGHKIEKRDAEYDHEPAGNGVLTMKSDPGTAPPQAALPAGVETGRTISIADIKFITKLIFTKMKQYFKAARAETKTWKDFLYALAVAAKNAVLDSVTEYIVYKTKQKLQETVQSYTGSNSLLGRIGGFLG